VEVQKIYQQLDEAHERAQVIKQKRLLVLLLLIICWWPGRASAQTISPVSQEYGGKSGKAITGSFSVTNNGIVPITAVVQRPQSLTFINGQPHLKALDPTVHVEIDQQSARLGARQSHSFAYRITTDQLPQAITFFTVLTRTVARRDLGGVQFAISLPSTAYLCEKQKGCRATIIGLQTAAR
jgi:hypothetical protein